MQCTVYETGGYTHKLVKMHDLNLYHIPWIFSCLRRVARSIEPLFYVGSLIKEGKVILLQAYGAQRVLGRLRLPDSVTSALEDGRLSALRTGRIYPQEYPGTHFKRLSRPRAHGIVRCHGKIPSDTTGNRSRDFPTSSAVP
jgi:hypothetical protein